MSVLPGNRKLKWWDSGPLGFVTVVQDGTTNDPDATSGRQYDAGFVNGVEFQAGQPNNDRAHVRVTQIRNTLGEGARMTVQLSGGGSVTSLATGSIRFQANDIVEFWADAPTQDTDVPTPAHHLNDQTGQVRYFYGWVESVNSDMAGGVVTVECVDGMTKGNDVTLVTDIDGGIEIPKIGFNAPEDSNDFDFNIKNYDPNGATTLDQYTIGVPKDLPAYLMSVKEILEYLEAAYGTKLADLDIVANASEVFVDAEIAGLTMIPSPLSFEQTGFVTAVQQILKWAPDTRLSYDPRNRKFHITRTMDSFQEVFATMPGTASSNLIAGHTDQTGFLVGSGNVDLFDTTYGNPGHYIHAVGSDGISSYTGRVVEKDSTYIYCLPQTPLPFQQGSKIYPLGSDTLPIVQLDGDAGIADSQLNINEDLNGVYSAVDLYSKHTKTTTETFSWSEGVETGLKPAWDRAYDSVWKPTDQQRHMDAGPEGDGLPVYTYDQGGPSSAIRLYVAFEESVFGDDHVDDEWNGCSVLVATANNANYRSVAKTFTITDFEVLADIGDTRPGMRITIDADPAEIATLPGFITETTATGAEVADRIHLDDDKGWGTGGANNGRSRVGVSWVHTSTGVSQRSQTPHVHTCIRPHVKVYDGSGSGGREIGLAPDPYPTRNQNHSGGIEWETLATGGLGAFHVFRQVVRTDRPLGRGCDGGGYMPPAKVETEVERATTTVRSARYPATGHAGWGASGNSLERVKRINVQHWFNDGQTADYEELAKRLWNVWQGPHYTGGVTMIGIQEHGAWLDLMVRIAFKTQRQTAGGGTILDRFFGVVASVTQDWTNNTVRLDFDNAAALGDLSSVVFEDWFITGKSELRDFANELRLSNQLPECLSGANRTAPSPGQCTSTLNHGPRPARPGITINNKDNLNGGLAPIAMAGSGGGKGGGTLGPRATETVFRDLGGNLFVVDDNESITGGAMNGSGQFVADPSALANPYGRGEENRQTQSGLFQGLAGLTPVDTEMPIFAKVTATSSSSGNTRITVDKDSFTVDEFVGGKLHIRDFDANNPRGNGYLITANAADSVTVADFAEAMPAVNAHLDIFHAPRYGIDLDTIPGGLTVVRDEAGELAVVTSSYTVVPASVTVAGDEVELRAGGTVTWGGALSRNVTKGEKGDDGVDGVDYSPDPNLYGYWNPETTQVSEHAAGSPGYDSGTKAQAKLHSASSFSQFSFYERVTPRWARNIDGTTGTNSLEIDIWYSVDSAPASAETIRYRLNLVTRDGVGSNYSDAYIVHDLTIPTSVTINRRLKTTMTVPRTGGNSWDVEANPGEFLLFNMQYLGSDTSGGITQYSGVARTHACLIRSGYSAP